MLLSLYFSQVKVSVLQFLLSLHFKIVRLQVCSVANHLFGIYQVTIYKFGHVGLVGHGKAGLMNTLGLFCSYQLQALP